MLRYALAHIYKVRPMLNRTKIAATVALAAALPPTHAGHKDGQYAALLLRVGKADGNYLKADWWANHALQGSPKCACGLPLKHACKCK